METIEISDVKTNADVHKIIAQKCIFNGYNTTLGIFLLGVATLPYTFTRINVLPRVKKEYKILVGVFITVGASYFSGVYVKNSCQRRIVKELQELNLGHLVERIQT